MSKSIDFTDSAFIPLKRFVGENSKILDTTPCKKILAVRWFD